MRAVQKGSNSEKANTDYPGNRRTDVIAVNPFMAGHFTQ